MHIEPTLTLDELPDTMLSALLRTFVSGVPPLLPHDAPDSAAPSVAIIRSLTPFRTGTLRGYVANVYAFGQYVPCTFSCTSQGDLLAWFLEPGQCTAVAHDLRSWREFLALCRAPTGERRAAPYNILACPAAQQTPVTP